ncbi:MAG: GNAT family N-acetyltransferase [Halobacteriaceae archaeon]
MPGPVFIEGERIDLRTVEEEDVGFLRAGVTHPAVRRYAGDEVPYNRRRYEDERFDRLSAGDAVQLLACDGEKRLGSVSLAPIDERRGWANLGYWIHPDRQGKGYATEAAGLVVAHGFDELRLHRISATVAASNGASERVVEKLGFVHEGTKRDDAFLDGEYVDREVYAVLREDWTARENGEE